MKTEDLLLLYNYNYWANGRILATVAQLTPEQFVMPSSYGHSSIRATLLHILGAEWIWRMRCQEGISPPSLLSEEQFSSLQAIRTCWEKEENAMRAYLQSLDDEALLRPVRYRTTDGQPQENVLWHLLTHVVIHGTEHRSEIARMLTEHGHSPGDLGVIHFLRTGA